MEILSGSYPQEWRELTDCLERFEISLADIAKEGGNKSNIPKTLDDLLFPKGRKLRLLPIC